MSRDQDPRTQRERMLAGEPYDASDPALVADRLRARALCQQFNALPATAGAEEQRSILARLFGGPVAAEITPPFFCDYGYNIRLGAGSYFNFNCVVLDVNTVVIGERTLFGPAVQIYTATHPMEAELRRAGVESGKPIHIGNDVWVGGGSIVCPGVRIGDGSVVGAGSVVTRDLPAGVFAAGNPCRVIRSL